MSRKRIPEYEIGYIIKNKKVEQEKTPQAIA